MNLDRWNVGYMYECNYLSFERIFDRLGTSQVLTLYLVYFRKWPFQPLFGWILLCASQFYLMTFLLLYNIILTWPITIFRPFCNFSTFCCAKYFTTLYYSMLNWPEEKFNKCFQAILQKKSTNGWWPEYCIITYVWPFYLFLTIIWSIIILC